MNWSIGADPEFFLKKDNKHVTSIGLIGGDKFVPRPLDDKGHAVLEDNVAVEFNIPPAHDHKAFCNSIQHVMQELKKELPDYEFSQESAVLFDKEDLWHPQAQEFGCEPDYNAWTNKVNPRPKATDASLRSAGGHVHVGTELDKIQVIRAMDLFLGVPSIKLDNGTLRRQLYGKAGAFRPKQYGVEYRTLSNFWIFSEKTIEWVYNQTEKALNFVKAGNTINRDQGKLIRQCINNSDTNAYEVLVRTY